ADRFLVAQSARAFDGILQFADVSRPVVSLEQFYGLGFDLERALRSGAGGFLQEMLHKQWDDLGPAAQRWQFDRDHREPVIKVFTEFSVLYLVDPRFV